MIAYRISSRIVYFLLIALKFNSRHTNLLLISRQISEKYKMVEPVLQKLLEKSEIELLLISPSKIHRNVRNVSI